MELKLYILLIKLHLIGLVVAPFFIGLAAFAAATSEKWQRFWVGALLLSATTFLTVWGGQASLADDFQGQTPWPTSDLLWSLAYASLGVALWFAWLRFGRPMANQLHIGATSKTALARNQKTDVRTIDDLLPPVAAAFDPRKLFDESKGFFLGLSGSLASFFNSSVLPHVQVVGTTGAGKGVVLGSLAAQCLKRGEAVFWLDPKDDEYAPHVLAEAAKNVGKPSHFIDLRPGEPPQINLLAGATGEEREEIFLAGFSLSEKGTESDFYTIDDRWGARMVAQDFKEGDTSASLFNRHSGTLEEKAKKFFGLLREMAELESVNAVEGVDLAKIIDEGGAIYVVGSMRNAKVVRMQRMVLVKIVQLCERRNRTQGKLRPVCVVLDEAKYHLSRPFLESLGAARDKGLHVILAHQSQADLRDCPADLNGDAVVGAVLENCSLKIAFRVQDPLTAEWLARKSGRIQVDDEVRTVVRTAGMSEVVEPRRQIRQSERFLIDENMMLNLRKTQAVVFGNGLPTFITTSPIPTTKDPRNLQVTAFDGTKINDARGLI